MKNLFRIAIAVVGALFITTMIINPLSAQTAQKSSPVGKPIPENVMKIAEKSCMKCHTEPGGNGMAASIINLSKWDAYSPEKQAAKAKSMCKMVSKNKMPPKNFKKSHPDGIPSKEEIATICDWSQSLQPPKK
jgi:hypothetical protein